MGVLPRKGFASVPHGSVSSIYEVGFSSGEIILIRQIT